MIAIPNAMEAGHIIDHGRALNPTLEIMVRAHTDGEVQYLRGHGVDLVMTGEREIADGMVEHILPDVA